MVALIPARAGSKRIPRKNIKPLGGHPVIAYTIHAALESGVFDRWVVATDDPEVDAYIRDVWGPRGVESRRRAPENCTDDAPDIAWVRERCGHPEYPWDAFAILRPTSPFRTAATIRRAYDLFTAVDCDSIRAVEPVSEHPGKMWWVNGERLPMTPVCDASRSDRTPWHSSPTQTLPVCYRQNASLEMAWTRVLHEDPPTISGRRIVPFFTDGLEGFDINTQDDWEEAEALTPFLPTIEAPCRA